MGIDYDSVLVFGAQFEEGELKTCIEDLQRDERYPALTFGEVSLRFNAPTPTYYVSLISSGNYDVDELREAYTNGILQYRAFFQAQGLNYREPRIFSLTHIW